jgi:hypothetical protein
VCEAEILAHGNGRVDFILIELLGKSVVVKVALNPADVIKYKLPSDMDAKPSSPNYESFVARHGTKAVEPDAIPVQLLQQKLRDAIERYLDMDEFNSQIQLEKKMPSRLPHIERY